MQNFLTTFFLTLLAVMPVAGSLQASESSDSTDPLPKGMDWPAWRGNGQGMATAERPQKLVESLDQARQVWSSETEFGEPSCSKGYDVLGGHGNFIVYDNRIYLMHYRGGGEVFKGGFTLEQHVQGIIDATKESQRAENIQRFGSIEEWARRKGLLLADDVLTCLDASTGRTLWEAVMPAKGANWHYVDALNSCPCTDGERVYFFGNLGRIYAVDAKTGALVWESVIPGRDPDKIRDDALAEAARLASTRAGKGPTKEDSLLKQFHSCGTQDGTVTKPRIVGRFLIVGEHGLSAFEPKTGKLAWGPIKAINRGNPMIWTHQGQEYIIANVNYARHPPPGLSCVDPRDGTVLWVDQDIRPGSCPPLIEGDLAYISGSNGWGGYHNRPNSPKNAEGQVRPALYQLSLTGATMVWQYDKGDRGRAEAMSPVFYKGHIYAKFPGTIPPNAIMPPNPGASGGVIACVELATQTVRNDALWSGLTDHITAKPWNDLVVGNDRLIFGRSKPQFMLLIDDPKNIRDTDAKRQAPGDDGTAYLVHPVLVDGRIFYRGETRIHCLDLRAR